MGGRAPCPPWLRLWRRYYVRHLPWELTLKRSALFHKSKNVWNWVAMTRWALRSIVVSLCTVLYLHAAVYFECGFFFGCMQYLNCKILLGRTLLQLWPNAFGLRKHFSENYVITSPKLHEDQKKGLRQKLTCFFPESRWRPKNKGLHRNLGLYSAGICRIYLCWLALFRLIIQRSNLDGGTPKSRWGDAKSRWGTLTLDGGRVPPTI